MSAECWWPSNCARSSDVISTALPVMIVVVVMVEWKARAQSEAKPVGFIISTGNLSS